MISGTPEERRRYQREYMRARRAKERKEKPPKKAYKPRKETELMQADREARFQAVMELLRQAKEKM